MAGAAHLAAERLKRHLARVAGRRLGAAPGTLRFAAGRIFAGEDPAQGLDFRRAAALAHWAPGSLPPDTDAAARESASWTPPALAPPTDDDLINGSAAYGFIFDFCGVEIDRATGAVAIDRYVTAHDAGRRLNPALVDGQIRGAFAHAVGAALYEELVYDEDGGFLSGTLADYLVPTASEIPDPVILHRDTPSPATPLGAKGVGEGNCMTTPVCIANAVADALGAEDGADALGAEDITLPLTPARVGALIHGPEPAPPEP